jgi:uncharacterized membrane protein (DUF2068 family)
MNESILPEESANSEENAVSEEGTQRPVVVMVIAVALFLNGIITLVTGLMFAASPIVLVSGTVALILSLGLWKLWSWAWFGTILLQLIALGFAFYYWYTLGSINFWSIGIAIIIILYLLRSEIRAAFFG